LAIQGISLLLLHLLNELKNDFESG